MTKSRDSLCSASRYLTVRCAFSARFGLKETQAAKAIFHVPRRLAWGRPVAASRRGGRDGRDSGCCLSVWPRRRGGMAHGRRAALRTDRARLEHRPSDSRLRSPGGSGGGQHLDVLAPGARQQPVQRATPHSPDRNRRHRCDLPGSGRILPGCTPVRAKRDHNPASPSKSKGLGH